MKKSSVVVVCDVAAVVDARDQILERLERSFVVFLHVDREQILRHLRSVGGGSGGNSGGGGGGDGGSGGIAGDWDVYQFTIILSR